MSWNKESFIKKTAKKMNLNIDPDVLKDVKESGGMCLCNPKKHCPCANITEKGCGCGLFYKD